MSNQSNQYNLGSIEQIPAGEGREFTVGGELVAVFRLRNGALYATQARCPHKQGPLADGIVGGETVVCPYHAWKFHLGTGLGLPTNPGEGCLRTYPVVVGEGGDIVLTVEPSPVEADSVAACA